MDKNLKMGPISDEKSEKSGLDRTTSSKHRDSMNDWRGD